MLNHTITPEILRAMTGAARSVLFHSHPSDIEDCVQAACVRALSSLESFDSARGDFAGWCYVIAKNVAKNWRVLAANNRHDSEGRPDDNGDAEALVDTLVGEDGRLDAARREDMEAAIAAMATLDMEERIFIMAIFDDVGQTEAGAMVGWSPATATRRRRSIAEKMKGLL